VWNVARGNSSRDCRKVIFLVAGFVVSATGVAFMKLKELQVVNREVKTLAEKEGKLFYYGRFVPNTRFMFVGEMPTKPPRKEDWDPTDNFNLSNSDKKFLEIINRNGFGGSFITDIIKKTENARRPTEPELSDWLPLLAEELGYIKPKVVIAVGKTSAYKILDEHKVVLNSAKLEWIYHPAYIARLFRQGDKQAWIKYAKKFSRLRKKYG